MAAVQLIDRDAVAAAKAHYRIILGTWWMPALLLILVVAFGWTRDPIPLFAVAGIGAVMSLSYFWTVPRAARRQLRELASLRHPIAYGWSADRFQALGANGSTDMPWSDLWAWAPYPGGYLLYPSSRMHYMVPERSLSADAEEGVMLAALDAAGVPRRRPFRRMKRRAG